MPKYMDEFVPPNRILMGAGPSNVNSRVLRAMSAPLLGHLDPDFISIMDDVKVMLRLVFQTTNNLTIPISGTGTAGMEAALVNVLEPGDTLIAATDGYFGVRLADIGARCGAKVSRVEAPWGEAIDPAAVEAELKKHPKVKAVSLVHAETSTGVVNPVKEIAEVVHRYGALLILDTVTSLGGVEVAVDKWGVDVCYAGTQKCLGCPPGLAPITLGPRAEEVLTKRKTPAQSWYFDLSLLSSYWGENRAYHHTAPISMIFGLREGLRVVLEEGLEHRFRRHERNAEALRAGLQAMGLELFAKETCRLPCLTSVKIPEGVADAKVRTALLRRYNMEIGGGLGPVAGKIWRIGLMGENSYPANVFTLLSALEVVLHEEGYEVAHGRGLAAAQEVLAKG